MKLDNLHVATERFTPIWGGNSLLTMFLASVRHALEDLRWTEWDFVQNLSETDFLLAPLEEFEAVMAA